MSSQKFWVSTGDIREAYEVVNVVAASRIGWLETDHYTTICRELVDDLARAALQMSANGVIWIQIIPVDKGGGMAYAFYATGTAVRVKAAPTTD